MGVIEKIRAVFKQRGGESYADEHVTQLQHALQCAALAESDNCSPELITAALLHDIGHIIDKDELPHSLDEHLDDKHEERAYYWLKDHFGEAVAEPVRLHVAAKRYLCTKEPDYSKSLSPTSFKSYLDQGGQMNDEELQEFERHKYFREALLVRKWDDTGKDAEKTTQDLHHFLKYAAQIAKP